VAVAAFLDNRLRFVEIPGVIEEVLHRVPRGSADSIGDILDADRHARDTASALLRAAA
jgi:1-deoxy-D-xylulose-5-phosphate reductoisomerase